MGAVAVALIAYGELSHAASSVRKQPPGRRPAIGSTLGRLAVSAGPDRRVVVGSVIELVGHVGSSLRGRPAQWRILVAPRDAHRRKQAQLLSATTLGARFQAKVLGQYTLRLTAGRGKGRVSDTVTLTAVPPTPMVPIETYVGDPNHPGIRVGTDTYAMPDVPAPALHLLVLDRKSLKLVETHSFRLSGSAWPGVVDHYLSAFDDGDLVIALTRPGNGPFPAAGVRPLARIGAQLLDAPASADAYYSAIGVPGMHAGEADEKYVPANGDPASPGMHGYLSPDQHFSYGFIPSTEFALHYGAGNRCGLAHAGVGDGPPCEPHRGFWVQAFDRYTFKPVAGSGRFFDTGAELYPESEHQAEQMAKALNAIPAEDVVTVESVSTRSADGAWSSPIGRVDGPTMRQLALAIAHVGGTRNAFNRIAAIVPAAASGGAVYTLVGWAGAAEGAGAESAADVSGTGDTASLDLVLRPDHHSLLRPAEVSMNGADTGALSELVLNRGKDQWPLSGDRGAMRAFAYLGSTDDQLGRDPRSAYWTQNLDQPATNRIVDELEHVVYPPGLTDFTKKQFEAARAELIQELHWVGKVRAYLSDLSSPFADGALSGWVTAQQVADKVYESVKPPDDETAMSWIEFVKVILHLANTFTAGATGHVAELLDFGVWAYGATKSGAPSEGEFRIKADELGARLVDHAQDAKAAYERVGDAIVSDYAALHELGTHAGCNPSDPKCPKQWAFTKQDRDQASVDVYRASEALAYQTLMPLAYNVYELNPAILAKAPIYQEQYKCGAIHPFSNVPTKASATLLQVADTGGHANEYQLYAMARPKGVHAWAIPPSDEIVDRMFGPVSRSGDPKAGGLGISQQRFLADTEHTPWDEFHRFPDPTCYWQP